MNTRIQLDRIAVRPGGIAAVALAFLLAACASSPGPTSAGAEPAAVPGSSAEPATAATPADEPSSRQRAAEAAERVRLAAERERQQQAELTRQRAEAERLAEEEERQRLAEQQRLEQERAERERLAALAAEREAKLARIAELEARTAELQAQIAAGDAQNETMRETVLVSEQLLVLLTEEQTKFVEANLDTAGNLIDPPATDAIADLEARRNGLLQQLDTC